MNSETAATDSHHNDAGQQSDSIRGWKPASPKEVLPTTLPILPVTERPFFPKQLMALMLQEAQWRETFDSVRNTPGQLIGVVMVRGNSVENVQLSDFYAHGTVARVGKISMNKGQIQFMAEGLERFRITDWLSPQRPYLAEVEYLKAAKQNHDKVAAYGAAITYTIKVLLPLGPPRADELKTFITQFSASDPEPFADFAANLITTKREELQLVLNTVAIIPRLEQVLRLARKELEVAKLQAQISKRVDNQLSDKQRKYVLQAQLKEIQRELGVEKKDSSTEEERFRKRLDGRDVPIRLLQRLDEELEKFKNLEATSPEYAVTRNYLDWLTIIPWGKFSEDNFDLSRARDILNADHHGLDDVKERIIELLAVGAFKGDIAGSIVLLVGPPGVGKTSIGRSIANALGRRFYRFSLGGMRDEAEIKGHRRTYVGAMPGKFIQAVKEIDASNPVIMLDEIDKIGVSYRGDPASALLEALDPEQNSDFLDHYLDVRFDLSKTLFVCTANQTDTIPAPLLDRMETINLAGYTTQEKVEIARKHLWPKQLARGGVKNDQITISDAALQQIAEGYAREAGVRNLEKQLGRIVRKGIVKLIEAENDPIHVNDSQLERYLGMPLFRVNTPRAGVGLVTGLAWTSMGGDTLTVEATRVHTKKCGFQLTGNLGDVMKESATIAYSYITANAMALCGDAKYIDEAFVHLHVPEGATPKDGPSAGVTMATSLLSLIKQLPVQRTLAMSGELTLTGQVLPVGGIKEKVIAARRAKVSELILPADNKRDFESLPDDLRAGLSVHFARDYQDVARIAFSPSEDSGLETRIPVKPSETTTYVHIR